MIPLFTKALSRLTAEDVEALRLEEVPESQTVEFKQTLAAKGGRTDPWLSGRSSIGDHARDDLLKEVVGFANSGGGNVVLGIVESSGHPKRAAGTDPLPRCHELAERLRLMARDCIEPQLPSLEVWGIATVEQDNDAGIVLFRVPPSRLAPHRLRPTLQCYVRRADRTEKMTMHEIQDASVRLARGGQDIERRLEESRSRYEVLKTPIGHPGRSETGIRVVALLVGASIFIDRVYQQEKLHLLRPRLTMEYDDRHLEPYLPGWQDLPGIQFRPVLRGACRTLEREAFVISQAIYSDGLIEFLYKNEARDLPIFSGHVIAMAANALIVGDAARNVAGIPGAELILDVELRSDDVDTVGMSVGVETLRVARAFSIKGPGPAPQLWTSAYGSIRLPPQSVGPEPHFKPALRRLTDDIENICGRPATGRFKIDL